MAYALGVLIVGLGLLISIALHELGHMWPAKKFGVRVSQYMVGFGPTLWSRQRGETEYGVKAIPLGGYVRLVGMIPPADEVKPVTGTGAIARLIEDTRATSQDEVQEGELHRAFYRLTWWRKVIVMFGGPFANLLIAAVLFTVVGSGFGVPTSSLAIESVSQCIIPVDEERGCEPGDVAAPAAAAGVQPGDVLVSVNGVELTTWSDFGDEIRKYGGQEIPIVLSRDGEEFTTVATPALAERPVPGDDGDYVYNDDGSIVTEPVGFFGVSSKWESEQQPWGYGVTVTGEYLVLTGDAILHLPQHVASAGRAAFGLEERSQDSVTGIVGIGRFAGEVTSSDIEGYTTKDRAGDLLGIIAGLNLALFAFNMIPLLPLDGGHIAGALWGAIKSAYAKVFNKPRPRPVDLARMMPLAYGVFAVLTLMGLLLIYADSVAPITLT